MRDRKERAARGGRIATSGARTGFALVVAAMLLWLAPALAQDELDAGAPPRPLAAEVTRAATLHTEAEALASDLDAAKGDARAALRQRLGDKRSAFRTALATLIAAIDEAGKAGNPASPPTVAEAKRLLQADGAALRRELRAQQKAAESARKAVEGAPDDAKRAGLVSALDGETQRGIDLLDAVLAHTALQTQLGVDPAAMHEALDGAVDRQARAVSALLTRTADKKQFIAEHPSADADGKKAQAAELTTLQKRLDTRAKSMRRLIDIMKARDLPSTDYQRLLIEKTGRLSKDVLDKDVATGLAQKWVAKGEEWLVGHAPNTIFSLIMFVLIVLASKLAARLARRVVKRSVATTQLSELAKDFAVTSAGRAVVGVGVVMGLSQLGIAMGPLLAGLGIAGFIVGFALQDALSNFASGLMILAYRPFDVGDLIDVAGASGVVHAMTLVSTSILTLDNQRLVVPNNKIWNNVIRNVTAEETRRVDFSFGIGYDDDIDKAEAVLRSIIAEQDLLLDDGEVVVAVHELADSSVNFVVRVWAKTEDYWDVHWAITAEVKRRFDAEGISIPYPQQDVHLHQRAS